MQAVPLCYTLYTILFGNKNKIICFEHNFALLLALLFVQNNESVAMFVYKKKILWELNSFHMLKQKRPKLTLRGKGVM